jgi:hypothetical protein
MLMQSVAEFASQYITERLVPLNRELALLRNENAELKGALGSVLQLLGKSVPHVRDDDTVVDLPRGFMRRVHDNAA